MLNVRKNDQVKVLAGKDRGKTGRVLRVFPLRNRAIVENVNTVRRHTRPNPQKNIQGGVVEREGPIHISNLHQPVRVGIQFLSDGKRVRVCRSCSGTIDK